jgi:hypothetical protein
MLGQKFFKFFLFFFWKLMTPKFPSEINWTLGIMYPLLTHPLISDSCFSLARCVTLSLDFTQMIASVADRTQVVAAVLLYLRRWFFVLTYAHPLFVRQIAGRHCSCTVGPNSKIPPKIKKSWNWLINDHTNACKSLSNFGYEAYIITGYGNSVHLPAESCFKTKSWNHIKWIFLGGF